MFLWVLAIFLALDLTVVGLLFIPKVQNFVIHEVTRFISKQWGAEISIGEVHITPSLNVTASDVVIKDIRNNPMISVEHVTSRLSGFSTKPTTLKLGYANAQHAVVSLVTYEGDSVVNISRWAAQIAKPKKEPSIFVLQIGHVILKDSKFSIGNQNLMQKEPYVDGQAFDPGLFEMHDLNADIKKFQVYGDSISGDIRHIAYRQYFGFHLHDFSGDFHINSHGLAVDQCKIVTDNSNMDIDLHFAYSNWKRLGDFLDSVQINANIRSSHFGLADAACYATAIRGMNDTLFLLGKVNGCINDMSLRDFMCMYKKDTYLAGNFDIKNITDFKNAGFDLDFGRSNVNLKELASFKLPAGKTIPLPAIAMRIGKANFYGQLAGSFPNILADMQISTGIGKLHIDNEPSETDSSVEFWSHLTASGVNIGQLLANTKYLGETDFNIDIHGNLNKNSSDTVLLHTLSAEIYGSIDKFRLLGYPLKDIVIQGDIKHKNLQAHVVSNDRNCDLNVSALLDWSSTQPDIRTQLAIKTLDISSMAQYYPPIDSATAKGIDKFLYYAQQSNDLKFRLDTAFLNLVGLNPSSMNGHLAIDGLKFYKAQNMEEPLSCDRLRFVAINTDAGLHKFILSSDIVNASLSTNYQLKDLKDVLVEYAYAHFGNILPDRRTPRFFTEGNIASAQRFLDINLDTYHMVPIFRIFLPVADISEHCLVEMHIDESREHDHVFIAIPHASLKGKGEVENFNLSLDRQEKLRLAFSCDSLLIYNQHELFVAVHDIGFRSIIDQSFINYQLSWDNRTNEDSLHSFLAGSFDAKDKHNLIAKIDDSRIYTDRNVFKFNHNNAIFFQDKRIKVQNLVFGNDDSYIQIEGAYSKSLKDNLNFSIFNFNLALLNKYLKGISFGGDLSAKVSLSQLSDQILVTGKAFVQDFDFNKTPFGNLFMTAGLNDKGVLGFSGGLFYQNRKFSSADINNYSIRDFMKETAKTTLINGFMATKENHLEVNADIDSLNLGFLEPFLASFSDKVGGTAAGKLSFISTPKASYMEGNIHIIDLIMNIGAIGTDYHVTNQYMTFNKKGIIFDNITVTDNDGNNGTLDGYIYHDLFSDMKINLNVNTNRIMALNLPKGSENFYGKGYVSGKVCIKGDDKGISIESPYVTTLKGTSVVFPITSTQSVSESGSIRFKAEKRDPVAKAAVNETPGNLALNFKFNITKDADIQVDVDAIGGTLRCNAAGPLQMILDHNDLNLYGNLEVQSGVFFLSLEDIINTKLNIVPGGKVNFDGPLSDFTVNIQASYSAKTSLSNMTTLADLNLTKRMQAVAYMNLNGELMKYPHIDFSFALPEASQDVRSRFFMTIDTTNPENRSKQFFVFLLTNQFMPDNNTGNNFSGTLENSGIGMITNFISNFISKQFTKGSVGIIYKNKSESEAAEYGINANIPFLNDRMIFETSIGYYDNRSTSKGSKGINDFYGDFSLEYLITPKGNWRVKVYNFNDQYNNKVTNAQNIPGVGLALMYKQEFNNKNDFKNDFKDSKIIIEKKNKKVKETD